MPSRIVRTPVSMTGEHAVRAGADEMEAENFREKEGAELEEMNEMLRGDWAGPPPASHDPVKAMPARGPDADACSPIAMGLGPTMGPAPPRRARGDPAWSLFLPRTVWDYLSRLEFYEGDATLPSRTRLFHNWWLRRRLPVSRILSLIYIVVLAPTVGLYLWVSTTYAPRQHVVFHVTHFVLSGACTALFVAVISLRARWSVASFSTATTLCVVLSATLLVLASFTDVRNRFYASGEAPASMLLPAATNTMIPNEYDDTLDLLYVLGLGTLSMVGVGVYPATPRAAWALYVTPLVYLLVSGAWAQPLERFLQVSLSHVLMLTQVRPLELSVERP